MRAAVVGLVFAIFAGIGAALSAPAAPAATESFDEWLKGVRTEALGKGIGQSTLDQALTDLQPIPRVIELDHRQPEFTLTFDQYLARVVPAARIEKGQQKYLENRALLEEIGRKYGVQPRFIVALWGIETDFGRISGGFPVIGALATLAYDGRRSDYFRRELMDALKILDQGHISVAEMMGSWAGAMGQSQFMPSSFVRYAQDYDGDGRRDIWTNKADVFASAANYLARSGWRDDQTWGRQVQLPQAFDRSLADLNVERPIHEWQAMGVRRADGGDLPTRDLMASIVLPADDRPDTAYMVYNNFKTILRWNRSKYFAVAVGTLADGIGDVR